MTARTQRAIRSAYAAAKHGAQHSAAPRVSERPEEPTRRQITQEEIDEWLANDEELRAWREHEARPRLW